MSADTMDDCFTESKSLKAEDLEGNEHELVITGYEVREFDAESRDGEKYRQKKPVLSFAGTDKTLVTNATNGRKIAAKYGKSFSDWIGKKVILFPDTTEFRGQTVGCIRVRIPTPMASKPLGAKHTGKTALPDDEIPFAPEWRG